MKIGKKIQKSLIENKISFDNIFNVIFYKSLKYINFYEYFFSIIDFFY